MSNHMTLARPYAKAVFAVALQANVLAAWSDFLQQAGYVAADPLFCQTIRNPLLSTEQAGELMLSVLNIAVDEQMQRFVRLLAHRGRLETVPAIAQLFEDLLAAHNQTIEVEVTSAFDLSGDLKQRLTQALSLRLSRTVSLHCKTDKALIGGAVVKAGDLVIDGSIRSKLTRMVESLVA